MTQKTTERRQQLLSELAKCALGMRVRNIRAVPQDLVELVTEIEKNPNIVGFEAWLQNNLTNFKHTKQLLDHINELREAETRLVELLPEQVLDISETPIAGTILTADLAIETTLVEIKTVRKPLRSSAEIDAQLAAGVNKFVKAIISGPFHVVIFASYDTSLFSGWTNRKGTVNSILRPDGIVKRKLTKRDQELGELHFFDPLLRALNTGGIEGSDQISRIDIRLENGDDLMFINEKGTWRKV